MSVFTTVDVELKRRLEEIPLVNGVRAAYPVKSWNSYYGMNVSSSIDQEPIDQLDGFLVAKFLQREAGYCFYPFIAGAYSSLNAKSPGEAVSVAERKDKKDKRKKQLLENVMSNLDLDGRIYTTYDLWDRYDYWEIFSYVLDRVDREEVERRTGRRGLRMRDFPKDVLGAMAEVVPSRLVDDWDSASLYIPIEVAEALWFNQVCDVSFKIGPEESESVYDDFIFDLGIGIIGLTQPEYREPSKLDKFGKLVSSQIRKTVPYIGRRGQNRILFSDNLVDISFFRVQGDNPSYNRAVSMAGFYEVLKGIQNSGDSQKIFELVKLGRKQL